MSVPVPTPASDRRIHEAHLRSLGLPLMIAPASRLREVLRRSAGVCAGLAVAFTGLAVLDRANDQAVMAIEGIGVAPEDLDDIAAVTVLGRLLLLAAALIVLSPLIGWLVSLVARRCRVTVGSLLGATAVVGLVVVPPAAFDPWDGPTVRTTAIVAAAVLLGTYVGVGSLVRWSFRRVRRELGTMGPMVARVLPVLMLAVLFLFFSAEIWQVMVEITWPRALAVVATMGALTVLLVVVTTRDDLQRELDTTSGENDDEALRFAERGNLLLVPVLATLIQAVLFAGLVFCFFLFLGWVAIPEATEIRWTRQPTADPRGLLAGVPVSVTLIRVALMLAAFSALNLAAAAASDAAHRARFVRPILDEVVHGLAAREAYLRALRRDRDRDRGSRPDRRRRQ